MGAEPVLRGAHASPVRMRELDAVTLDAYGTLLRLRDPLGHLDSELRARGVELPPETVERGFRAEADYYAREHLTARDGPSLAALRTRCADVFLTTVGVELDRGAFSPALAYEYELLPGVPAALDALAARGLALAVVANWDFGLHEQLRRHGLAPYFAGVVVAAEVGAAKPDPRAFRAALERLGVSPERALHVGDSRADEDGAAAAGLHFAPAPLPSALRELG